PVRTTPPCASRSATSASAIAEPPPRGSGQPVPVWARCPRRRATAAPEYEGKGPLTCPATPVNNPRARSVVHGSTPLPWVSTLVARAAATAGEEDKERCRDNTRSTTSWLRSTSGAMRRYH